VSAADLWLFKPATTYRVRPGSDQSTPVPRDEALAENPPDAQCGLLAEAKARGPVELELFDRRRHARAEILERRPIAKRKPEKPAIAMEWVREAAAFRRRLRWRR